jgi:HEAT repeat protein
VASAAALSWVASSDHATQGAGLDVLGNLVRDHPELVPTVLKHVGRAVTSPNEDVRWSAAVALQNLPDDRGQSLVLGLLDDADSDVRYQAVNALPWSDGQVGEDHPVVQALVRAMEDPDDLIRDWATFGLGQQVSVDTPAVRDAFARHLRDAGQDTAGEAARALAVRGDRRVHPVLLEQLRDPEVRYLFVWAAEVLPDPDYQPLLRQLQAADWPHDGSENSFFLSDAITACSPGRLNA